MLFMASLLNAQTTAVYPLHLGDRWLFADWWNQTSFIRKVIGDTVMPNGKTYAQLLDSSLGTYRTFQRQSGDSILQYATSFPSQELLLFQFSRSNGDTIATYPRTYDTTYVILRAKSLTTQFGAQRWTWSFLVDYSSRSIDDESYYTVVDSIGIARNWGFGWDDMLIGALINGVLYGWLAEANGFGGENPAQYALYQNFPNPFNPTTRIDYQLPAQSYVTLKVYDLLGQEVATVINAVQEPGHHSVQFNASDLSSGVYFYHLKTGEFSSTRKMAVVK